MCGITGFMDSTGGLEAQALLSRAKAMASRMRHRGPDDSGEWCDAAAGVGLGFRRLSIIDLSPAGHQPMTSRSGRYVIVFNGEVYNFEELRKQLLNEEPSLNFRGHSDTEVILAAFEAWGLRRAVSKFIGMFAFAVWDNVERRLHLVRDRAGVKPLYYGYYGRSLLFASELKAFAAHADFRPQIDRDAVALFMRFGYIPAPWSIYSSTFKIEPGMIYSFSRGAAEPQRSVYWSPEEIAADAFSHPSAVTEAQAEDELHELLFSAIGYRMISDVPLGVFLSGGIDSSLVAAIMQAQSNRPVKSFTIGFREAGYDEAGYARAVARTIGSDHCELYVTATEAQNVIPRLADIYDEPFADASQIPTYLVSKLARTDVTVALSGDGGDELFGGYERYFRATTMWGAVRWMNEPVRRSVSGLLRALSSQKTGRAWSFTKHLPGPAGRLLNRDKVGKLAEVVAQGSADDIYRRLISLWRNPGDLVHGAIEQTFRGAVSDASDFRNRMMLFDFLVYLPDDILVKVDRASMAVSLEAREPLLDHRLIEFAWRLPLKMKMGRVNGKRLLKRVLSRYLSAPLFERPKMGFGVPLDQWLRGALRPWAEELLSAERLTSDGILDVAMVRQCWDEHLAGQRNWQYRLWNVLMFQAWLDARRNDAPAAVPDGEVTGALRR